MKRAKFFIGILIYFFTNYFVENLPCWHLRKLLLRLVGMKIGKGARINMKCIIMCPWRISIGRNTMINEYVLLDGRGGLIIGNSTSVSMFSVIYTGSHKSYSDTFECYTKPTMIGDCCWIGTHSIIMPGSNLNDRAIISVNSVFKGEAEENGIYVGNPAVMTRKRELTKNYEMKILEYLR